MDAEYLQQNIGSCLSQCLAEVCMKRPNDPIEYIAHWLYKHIDNVNTKNKVSTELFSGNKKKCQNADEKAAHFHIF